MARAAEWCDWFVDSMSKEEAVHRGFGKEMSRHRWTCLMMSLLERLGEEKGFDVRWEDQKVDMVWYSKETGKPEVAIEHELRGDRMRRLEEGEVRSLKCACAPLRVLIVCFRPTKGFGDKLMKLECWVCSPWRKPQGEFLVLVARRQKDHAPEGRWEAYKATPRMANWEALRSIKIHSPSQGSTS